ncbi:MAG: O-antigen ligase family protein [Myxococcota bacterium]
MQTEGNLLALSVLFLWIPVAFIAFRNLPPSRAATVVLVGGLLVLPGLAFIRIPGLAAYSKETAPALWSLVALLALQPQRALGVRPFRGISGIFLLGLLGAVGTGLTNSDVLRYGPRSLEGVGIYESLHRVQYDVLTMFVPFYVARLCYRSAPELTDLMWALAAAAVAYTPLVLLESYLSPQLHGWIYGVRPIEDFSQTMRWGGWRPNVFFSHGLALAVFMAVALLAAAPFARNRWTIFAIGSSRLVFAWLALVLALCRSLGAWVYGLVGTVLVWLGSTRLLFRAAALVATLTLCYPLLRLWDWFPEETLVSTSRALAGEERAASLEFRFENETDLLEKASERWLFGWGEFGRAAIYDDWSGQERSVRDGAWIILLGERGLFGYAAAFGLLVLPVYLASRRLRHLRHQPTRQLAATLTFMVAITGVDLLPNGLFNYLPFVLAGALTGITEGLTARSEAVARARWNAAETSRRPWPRDRGPAPAR